MVILITGVTGQVGGALCQALARSHSVVPADRLRLDLSRIEQIAPALDGIAPELIINPAAYTAVDRAEDEKDLAYRINAEAPGAIARWAAGRGIPLIHFSTDYVFDGAGDKPWREGDPANPSSAYGQSKLAGEQAVRSAAGPHLIVRTSWVYAARGANFLLTIARLAGQREELRVVADQIGAPTSARIIADALAQIVDTDAELLAHRFAAAGNVVNMAASGETSWWGFASAIVDGLKARGVKLAVQQVSPIASRDYPTKARRPANSRLDLTRLKSVFDIDMPYWEEGLRFELDRLASRLLSPAASS